jgi:hypothetical protein
VVFGPYSFALTDAEAQFAASRIALRSNLGRRFERDYVAPLVVFVLALIFIAILAFSGLISRRSAEAALLIGAIVFLSTRFLAHWRLRHAQRAGKVMVETIRKDVCMSADVDGLTFEQSGTSPQSRRLFQDFGEAEDAGGVIYLWRRDDDEAPVLIPTRIFADEHDIARFLAFARAKITKR